MVIEEKNSILICFASQKGTAQSIAEEIKEKSTLQDLRSSCHLSCISEIKSLLKLSIYSCVIFVGSTTGEGDPPDTALGFMRELQKEDKNKISLSWLNYTILGLGDTNYTNFCNFGKTLDKCLQDAKAQRFYECGWADDGVGLEIVIEPWLEGLFPALKTFLNSIQAANRCAFDNLTYLELNEASQNNFDQTHDIPCWEKRGENKSDSNTKASQEVIEFFEEKLMADSMASRDNLSKLFPSLSIPSDDEIMKNSIRNCSFKEEQILTLPANPSSFLSLKFHETKFERSHWDEIDLHSVAPYPLARSHLIPCRVARHRCLTKEDAVKKALEITLEPRSEEKFDYDPGDAFGIIVENEAIEVSLLLGLLQIEDKADLKLDLTVDPSTQKKNAQVPRYLPSTCSLRYIFTRCLDIRAIPKKLMLRALVEHTRDAAERRRLSEWVSKEGSAQYTAVFREEGLTLLHLLILFPSCIPPPSLLLEHLPRLLPRSYSATSSPLVNSRELSFVFNVVKIQGVRGIFERKGLCTGWLDDMTKMAIKSPKDDSISAKMEHLQLASVANRPLDEIQIYFHKNQMFRLPKDINTPLIMIGPGTGVAPFIGFLKHREMQLKETDASNLVNAESSADRNPPLIWLFFGCRNEDKDYLFREELEDMVHKGLLTRLSPSFSRDERPDVKAPKYVQDNLLLHGEVVVDWIHSRGANVYVCGDAKNMARNVQDTFILLFQKHLNMNEQDARKYLAKLQMTQKYLQDVWA